MRTTRWRSSITLQRFVCPELALIPGLLPASATSTGHGNSQTPAGTLQQKASSHYSPQFAFPLPYPVLVFGKLADLLEREKQREDIRVGRENVKALVHWGGQCKVGEGLETERLEEPANSPKV